jgi:outer membrane immunogenic protein
VKNLLLRSTAVSALLTGQAFYAVQAIAAPPTPAPAVYNWTGFYVGANAGGAWGRSSANTSADCSNVTFNGQYFCGPTGGAANAAAVNAAGSGTIAASGFTGGLQVGYNWQLANLIYGVETDFGAFHLRGSRQGTGTYPVIFGPVAAGSSFAVNPSFSTNWLYTLRGRVGMPVSSNLMAYATGGLALTRLGVSNSFSDNAIGPPGASESANRQKIKTGWSIGGGLEWAFAKNWSVKAEYLYIDFGKVTVTGTIVNPGLGGYSQGISTNSDLTAQMARIGVNRKF